MLNYHIVWKCLHFLSSEVQSLVILGLFLAVISTEELNSEGKTWMVLTNFCRSLHSQCGSIFLKTKRRFQERKQSKENTGNGLNVP